MKKVSPRQLERYHRYAMILNWGRSHPIEFCKRFMGIDLLDLQKYTVYNTWFATFAVWLKCRNGSKTTELAIYSMLRSLLFPNHVTYFLGNTGEQAKETFKKIEKIAKKEVESFVGCTDFFMEEIDQRGPTGDGFSHYAASWSTRLYNGAEIYTLNSDPTNIKGKRANLVCFDEAGWFTDELFVQAEQFVNQDENFKLGGGIDISLEPKGFPKQLLYASSASDTSSGFYRKFKSTSTNMIMGDKRYFACDFTIDSILHAKFDGDPYPPLISKEKVDRAVSDNHEKAMRELYNKFSADSYQDQILTRRDLIQCTKNRPPLLTNDINNRIFVLAWDSARINDNSVIGAAEFRNDEKLGWCMDIHNVISLVDVMAKNRTPMRLPEQVECFKEILLAYNGAQNGNLDYENIKAVVCDAGAGGQMIGGVTDYLLADWKDKDGTPHKGLIDRQHKANETARITYPDAVDIIKLVDPRGHRKEIFDAAEAMTKLGVVTLPAEYDGGDSLYILSDDGEEHEYRLSHEEKISLMQIELMKTEIITMCKYSNNGNITYNYPPEKRNTMHDDRAFVYGLLCWYLASLRRGQVVKKQEDTEKSSSVFQFRAPQLMKGGDLYR